jgi:hypothetical protein
VHSAKTSVVNLLLVAFWSGTRLLGIPQDVAFMAFYVMPLSLCTTATSRWILMTFLPISMNNFLALFARRLLGYSPQLSALGYGGGSEKRNVTATASLHPVQQGKLSKY